MLTTQFIPIVVIIGGLVTPEPAIFPARAMELVAPCDRRVTFHAQCAGTRKPNHPWRIMNPGEDFGDQNDDRERFPAKARAALDAAWTRFA
jgi:hypothetical protein